MAWHDRLGVRENEAKDFYYYFYYKKHKQEQERVERTEETGTAKKPEKNNISTQRTKMWLQLQ